MLFRSTQTLDTVALSAAAGIKITGSLSSTLDDITLLTGTPTVVSGALSVTLDGVTVGLDGSLQPIPGGLISGGTFSRRKWHEIKSEQERKRLEAKRRREQEEERQREIAAAADRNAKAAIRARWAQEDALAAARQYELLTDAAQRAFMGAMTRPDIGVAQRIEVLRAIQAKQAQDDEEEAIALLMLHS